MQPSETGQDARRIGRGRCGPRGMETLRIEQLAAARLNEMAWMAVMDQAEQREQPPPGAAPLVHRVGIERGVASELGVEAAQRIARLVDLRAPAVGARGQEVAVLGVEHEDEPHQDGEQALVEMLGRAARELAMSSGSAASSPRSSSCRAPSTCSASAVETAACASRLFCKQRRQASVAGVGEQAERVEQQLEAAEHRPAGDRREGAQRKAQTARGLAASAHRRGAAPCRR